MKRSILVLSAALLALGIASAQPSTPAQPVTELIRWVEVMPTAIDFNTLSTAQTRKLYVVLSDLKSNVNGQLTDDQAQQALQSIKAALPAEDLQALQTKASHGSSEAATINFNDVWAQYNTALTTSLAGVSNWLP